MSSTKCITPMKATSNGVWQHDNPIHFSFPLLVIQVILVLVVTRTLAYVFRPLRQPRVIAEIIGGILLGPTALGRVTDYKAKIFPAQSITLLDTIANLGLVFFLFMVGLELDLKALRKLGSQTVAIAAAGMCLPFALGAGVSVIIHNTISTGGKFAPFLVFMGVAMSITAFPVLARILAERKLLTTDVGQMAMSAAAVNDVSAWILLALAVALSGTDTTATVVIWVLLCGIAFVAFMFVAVKPVMSWMARQSLVNEPIKETYVCVTFALVLCCGFTTDAIGIHSIFGGFVLGLVIPKDGSFAHSIIEKIEDFVSVLLLPLYFASSGLKTNIGAVHGARGWGILVLVIVVACFGKMFGTFAVSQLYTRNRRKSLVLGILMNTKGLVELIVLNIGKDRGVLNEEIFAIMVLMALFTTFITTPLVMTLYKPARNVVPYTRRQLYQDVSPKEDLRILSCVHDILNVPTMINLTETVRGQTKHTLRLYILHLTELSERSSAIMMVQRARRDGRPFWDENGDGRTDRIVIGFEAFESLSKVTVRPMTAISQFEDMHEDICSSASDKRASLIILPFHRRLRFDGAFENRYTRFRAVNRRVLQQAPCSVGILIDRGLWGPSQISPSNVNHCAVVLFFGGPDDREALAFGLRMAQHPGVRLKIVRFTADLDLDDLAPPLPAPVRTSSTGLFRTRSGDMLSALARTRSGEPKPNSPAPPPGTRRGEASPARRSGDPNPAPLARTRSGDAAAEATSPAGRTKPGPVPEELSRTGSGVGSSHFIFAPELDPGLERQLDEDLLSTVRAAPAGTAAAEKLEITYEEVDVKDLAEAVEAAGQGPQGDLLLVGRAHRPSPLLAQLSRRRQPAYSELGPVGDILASSACRTSVLVVQQYDPNLAKMPLPQILPTQAGGPPSTVAMADGAPQKPATASQPMNGSTDDSPV